ncbi:MAG: hypothetical protein Q7J16_04795 [Candidatus Cloacimonadales bacterium]|nr:hypothetical protein [Candidatus Cloacimonadales bacterium]
MKKIFVLKILDRFAFLFDETGMDYRKVRLLLQLKFNLDRRRSPLGFKNINLKPGKDRNLFIFSILFYGLVGIMFLCLVAMLSLKSLFLGNITFFTVLMIFISYAVIIEFSQDMFDLSDREILLPKPVTLRELNMAKNLHIIFYMLGIALSFSLPTLVFWGIKFGILLPIISVFSIVFCLFFMFFCSAFFYGMLLKNFSGERLKDIINLIQIISMIVIFIGYQIFVQTSIHWLAKIDFANISNLIFLFPPAWFAMPGYIAATGSMNPAAYLAGILGIGLAIFGYRFYLSKMAPSFEKNLYKLNLMDTKNYKKRIPSAMRFAGLFRSHVSQALYKFSVIILSRERKLIQSIYPLLVMGLVFPFIMIYKEVLDPEVVLSQTKHFYFMYYTVMMMMPLSIYLNYSENYQAAWIYRFLPVKSPGIIIKSGQFAMFFKYQIIILTVTCLGYLYLWKFTIIEHVIAVIINCLILQMIYQNMTGRKLPFSEELKTGQNTAFRQGSYLLTVFIFAPLLAGMHYASTLFDYGIFAYIFLQIIGFWLLFRNHYQVEWKDL